MHSNPGINKIFLIGYIETTPTKHFTNDGPDRFCFVLCTKEVIRRNDQSSEHKEFHHLYIHANHPDIKGLQLQKGTLLYITGKIQTKASVDDEGIKRYKTEIAVSQLEPLHSNIISF